MPATLKKDERLSSFKEIEALLLKGQSFFSYPFKVNYLLTSSEEGCTGASIVISVPKRNFKRAVKRNLIRRRIRESYRLNKEVMNIPANNKLHVMFVYISKEVMDYHAIEPKLKEMLVKFGAILNKTNHVEQTDSAQ
ncbi:MAG: ribonuclease P protein component [Bacteroidales bacterium]